jgi:hypothetical protein
VENSEAFEPVQIAPVAAPAEGQKHAFHVELQ